MSARGRLRTILSLLALGMALPWGLSAPAPPPQSAGSEIALVKKLLTTRRDYQLALEQLRAHYVNSGDAEKQRWAEDELKQYHRNPKQSFIIDLDIPGPGLRAEQNVPAANEMYRVAMSYKDKGFGSDFQDNQIRAELKLEQLLNQYPTCNKISDAAYQLGDLYEGKVFNYQYRRAAVCFERCVQWNPTTQYDARLRAARLYDRYLSERSRAIELYKAVLTHETDPRRMQEAQRRLTELGAANP